MKFLVTNDDGIHAPGIQSLVRVLWRFGDICVVAPEKEQSGMSHAITVHRPLRLTEVPAFLDAKECYMVDGTPADCVKMAIQGLNFHPDLVVSGINSGANLGTDVLYSGTVSAAIESVILGFPAIAFSLCGAVTMLESAEYVIEKTFLKMKNALPKDGLLNVNIPALPKDKIKGVLATTLGVRTYNNTFEKRIDPRGKAYYWMGGDPVSASSAENNDHIAVEEGYVSVTPIQLDITYHSVLKRLKDTIEGELV